jgi:uncharacterized protein (TIRG00374 family)
MLSERTRSLVGIFLLLGGFVFIGFHFKETEEFMSLIFHSDPKWVVFAVGLQLATYVCSGAVFYELIRSAGHHVPFRRLVRLSVERMSVNQLVPAAGFAGHAFIFGTIRGLGLPRSVATEAVFVDTLSYYFSYLVATAAAFATILVLHVETPLLITVLGLFFLVGAVIIGGIFWIFSHHDRRLPKWLTRFNILNEISESVQAASATRVRSPWLLFVVTFYGFLIFALDGATLWAIMEMISAPIGPFSSFAAFVVSSIVGSLSLLPGGVGGFEATSVLALRHLDVPLGAALTATLLLRGLTLWLPLIPGSIFAAKYLAEEKSKKQ